MERGLIIGFESAFDLWRLWRADRVDRATGARLVSRSCCPESDLRQIEDSLRSPMASESIRALRATGLPRPLTVVAPSARERFVCSVANSRVWSHAIPDGNLTQVAPGILVCSPYVALLQMSSSLDYAHLAQLAYELCGTYVLAPVNEHGATKAICNLEQRFDAEGLRTLAERWREMDIRGAARLSGVLKDVLNCSNSPAESALALMFVAPRAKGGFGLRDLALNQPVELSDAGRNIMYRGAIRPDGLFASIGEAYELDTKTWHDSPLAHEKDSDRRAALAVSGTTTHSITSAQAYSLDKLTVIGEGFARRLGLNQAPANKRMLDRRRELHAQLFPKGTGSQLAFGGHLAG